jgi:hypothetical protein
VDLKLGLVGSWLVTTVDCMTQIDFDFPSPVSSSRVFSHARSQYAANENVSADQSASSDHGEQYESRLSLGLILALGLSVPLWFLIVLSLKALVGH